MTIMQTLILILAILVEQCPPLKLTHGWKELMMRTELKDKLLALPPASRAKVINAAQSVISRRVKQNTKRLLANIRSPVKPQPK